MTFLRFLFSKYFFKHIFYMILIVLFAMPFGIIALRFMTDHGDYVKVPDLKGKTLDSVAIELDKLDLKYIILDSGNYNPNYKIFSVLDQQPKFDSKVKEGRKIYLTINSSDFKMVEVPNVMRTTIRQARKSLESLGFIIGEIEYIDDIGKDEVISFSYQGKQLKPGDTLRKTSVIDFKLGNGKL
jgi:eukaryotic-like serine/threonine-protein kinase